MEHLIRFTTAEGIDGTHMAATLDEAVAFAERIRNTEGATEVRLHRLTEVPIEFKPYYRIEVGAVDAGEHHQPSPPAHLPAAHGPLDPSALDHDGHSGDVHADGDPQGTNGRRLFSRVT